MPPFAPGSVWLVGAGPGDPGLLTVLALQALTEADVVVYDALVGEAVLALVRGERVFAGKRGGRPSTRQPDITERLIALARGGRRVCRLKGGDPCLFGRGGEEALALAEAGIPFRLVPGVTAAIAGLAYAGIPATYRETNSAIAFVTGHASGGGLPDDVDWPALARALRVIVFYMPLRRLADITGRLIAAGRAPETPAAIIAKATTAEQRVVQTTLASAVTDAEGVAPPALFVVGEVVRLAERLAWFDPEGGARGLIEGRP